MSIFEYEGKAAHYIENGDGDPVVMLHAGGSSGRQWRNVIGHLEADYRLIAPDLYGFGETEPWNGPGELTHDAQAALVQKLIEMVCDRPVHVIGHSYGGATAMRLWLAAPELVQSLVFIEPIELMQWLVDVEIDLLIVAFFLGVNFEIKTAEQLDGISTLSF